MMNVLQRKMFANGDVANTEISEPLIRYYVSQGYNPAEIKAVYPAAPYGLIEQIAMEFGGVVNPGVQGRNSTGYTEDMPQAVTEGQFRSLLNEVPMNETIVTGSPTGNLQLGQISPPSMPIQDDIQMSLGELNDPKFDAVIQGNYMGIPTPEVAGNIDPSLPTEREIAGSASSSLGPNQYKASNGKIYEIDPATFAERMRNENSRVLQGYIYNPYVEYGPTLKKIIEDEAYQRQSTISGATTSIDEARNENPQALNFGGAFQSIFEGAKDIGLEGTEKIVDFGRAALPGLAGIFQGRRQELAARKKLGQPFEIETGMGDPAYNRLGGETKENLDQFILESSIGQVSDPIQNSINDANKTDAAVVDTDKISTEVVTDETATEAEEKATEGLDFSKYAPDLQERLNAELSDTSKITGKPTEQEQENINRIITNQGSFFSSPDWNGFIRNLGLGLSGSADLAAGLVKGTALGSQEKALREAEALKADQEERLERIKAGAKDSLKPTDIVSLNKMTSEMSTNIKDFEGSRASIGIMNDAISLFEEAVAKGVKVTGLQGKIARFTDQGKAFFNVDSKVSDATKIQNYIDQVKQRSIREILRESGRTISNLDREIVDKVFGELNLVDSPQETLKKLINARNSLLDSNLDKQRQIGTNYSSITNEAYGTTGLRIIAPYETMIQQILNANPSTFGTMQPIQGAINVDLRGQNIFGNI